MNISIITPHRSFMRAAMAGAAAGALTVSVSAHAQETATPVPATVQAPADVGLSTQTLKDVTRTLASDEFEGRAPGTVGEEKSIAYIAQRFAAAGLEPGADGSWYQDVPMVELTPDPSMTLEIAGGDAPLTLEYKRDMAVYTHRPVAHIDIADSDVVFVGYGINAPELGWNDYEGLDVRGKTVLVMVNDPDWDEETLSGPFGGKALTYYGRWPYKFEEAARQGAAAAFVIHDDQRAAYGWNVVVSSNTGTQLIVDDASESAPEAKAIGWISHDAARRVLAADGQDLDALETAAGKKGFRSVPLGLRLTTRIDNTMRRIKSYNVVGVLPGAKRPGEYVMLTAHWDHLGHCEPVDGDDICNGAFDNASGTAGLVALAEAYGKAGPADRTAVFIATTGEESWLAGSEYYARHPIYPLSRTAGGVNLDGLSIYGAARDVTITGVGRHEMEADVARLAIEQGQSVEAEPMPENGNYFRSDHFSFAKRGVPMAYFANGQDLVEGGKARGEAAARDYIARHYHAPSDEYDPDWDWSGAIQELTLTYRLTRELADSSAWPNWTPTSEFRAIRDASADER